MIFRNIQFSKVVEGPEVEYADYNFTKLNIPENHPARDEQDTYFINDSILLRSQTSPVQARTMEKGKLPIRMIAPGRVFRSDEVDATHSPSFHQIEGLVIDKNITFADLKGTLQEFAQELFGPETKTKFRPHNFPFTEPSAEVDVSCFKCGGKGCRFCKGSGWIEILGCGMVHPNVLSMCGIDPVEYTGFAFGCIALLFQTVISSELFQETDIILIEQSHVINLIFQKCNTFKTYAKCESCVFFRINSAHAQYIRMNHTAAKRKFLSGKAAISLSYNIERGLTK